MRQSVMNVNQMFNPGIMKDAVGGFSLHIQVFDRLASLHFSLLRIMKSRSLGFLLTTTLLILGYTTIVVVAAPTSLDAAAAYVSWDNNFSYPVSLNCASKRGYFQDDHKQPHVRVKQIDLQIATSNRVKCEHWTKQGVPTGLCKGHVKNTPMDVVVEFRAVPLYDRTTHERFNRYFFVSAHSHFVSPVTLSQIISHDTDQKKRVMRKKT